jgi:hypothetical protein
MRATPTTRTGPVAQQRRRCRQRPQHRPDSHSAWTDGGGPVIFTLGAIGYGLYGGAALLRGATGQGGKGMEDILWGEAGYIGTNGRVAREFFGKGRSLRIFNGVKAFIQLQWLFPQRAE